MHHRNPSSALTPTEVALDELPAAIARVLGRLLVRRPSNAAEFGGVAIVSDGQRIIADGAVLVQRDALGGHLVAYYDDFADGDARRAIVRHLRAFFRADMSWHAREGRWDAEAKRITCVCHDECRADAEAAERCASIEPVARPHASMPSWSAFVLHH
jgi:hypothetical protein